MNKEMSIDMPSKDKTINAINAHFKQWQEITGQMSKNVSSILKQQEESQKAFQQNIDALKKSLKTTPAKHEIYKKIVESIPKYELPDFEGLKKTFRDLPIRTQEALLLLGEYGWYVDLKMSIPELWELKKALSEGKVDEAESALVDYFEKQIDEIEFYISKKFPKRKKLINAAFNAHRRQEYELSIPVFLIQSDGICKEVINEDLFRQKKGIPNTANYVEQVALNNCGKLIRNALLNPLKQTLPIRANKFERKDGFNNLNRHMVIHGEDLEYGSKINSLKAISLINYIANVLQPLTTISEAESSRTVVASDIANPALTVKGEK